MQCGEEETLLDGFKRSRRSSKQLLVSAMEGAWMLVWTVLLAASVLWPHPAYIHPDEFFQSTEVIAGDIFNITHLRTWEFAAEAPLRDITLPYLLLAPGFYLLQAVLQSAHLYPYIVPSYAILVIPRILLVLAGAVNYMLVRRLCKEFSLDQRLAGWYWCTSYVTWTFLTRSFSNTTETLLFSLLILLLLKLVHSCRGLKLGTDRLQVHAGVRTVVLCSGILGGVVCIGIFNRPTFALFILVPLAWWADQLTSAKLRTVTVLSTVFSTGAGFMSMFVLMALSNSLYYNPEFTHLLKDLYTSMLEWDSDLIFRAAHAVVSGARIPPWNFVKYNLLSANLADHGLHPWYIHFLVNVPLLVGPSALLFYWDLAGLLRRWREKQSGWDVLYAMVVCPVVCLSLIPHQEARYLLPVLPVLVVCVTRNSVAGWRSFQAVAVLFNVLGLVLFGWLHQGGLVPALSSLHSRVNNTSSDRYHIMSFNTYMPPRHLLLADASVDLHVHDNIGVHGNPSMLHYRLEQLQTTCQQHSVKCHYFLLLPATAVSDVQAVQGWQVREEGEFCPHLSMERPPVSPSPLNTVGDVYAVLSQLCLKLMSVSL